MSRNQQETPTRIPGRGITLRETDLFEVWCHAIESGEFVQVADVLSDGGTGRCVWGVAYEMAKRAGAEDPVMGSVLHPRFTDIQRRAGGLLGYQDVAEANDAGCSFKLLAPALRAARIEVERGQSLT